MATKRRVEAKLRELIARLERTDQSARVLSEALPSRRIVAVHIPDLGATYWTELSDGRMGALHDGDPERPDMRLEALSDDLIEVIDGRQSMFSSYIAGRMKIEASFADMLRLRKLA